MQNEKLVIQTLTAEAAPQRVISLSGPLVLTTFFEFQRLVRADTAPVLIDLANVPYVDSAGMGALVNAYVSFQKNGRRLMLALTHLDQLLETHPDWQHALSAVGDPVNV